MSNGDDEKSIADTVSQANDMAGKGPIAKLLNPAFEVLGQEFGEWTKRVVDRRRKNVADHIEAVRTKRPEIELEPTPENQENLNAWTAAASKHGEGDPMSALWRGVFERIVRGDRSARRLIELATDLDHQDMRLLDNGGQELAGDRYAGRRARLIGAGLIVQTRVLPRLQLQIIKSIISALFVISIFLLWSDALISIWPAIDSDLVSLASRALIAFGVLALFFLTMEGLARGQLKIGMRVVKLTDDGQSIVDAYRLFSRRGDADLGTEREEAAEPADPA